MAKYVIIGNSAAGIGCVEGIRSVDREGDILLIAAEPHHTYGRPLISYLLEGKTDETRMKYRPDSFYAENGVETRLGVRAVRLDPSGKTVELEDGAKVPYTQLLVATGSVPFVPPMDGLETVEKRFSFMTLDDAKALRVPEVGSGRTQIYIDAIEKAKKRITDRPVLAGIIGPYTLAGRLIGMSEIMMASITDPEMVETVLEKATEFIIAYARAYRDAGADGFVMAEPTTGLISPKLARKLSHPYTKAVIDAVQTREYIVVYHNCGESVVKMTEDMSAFHAEGYHFGNCINMADILPHLPADSLVMGNVAPAEQFCVGTPEGITENTREILEACDKYPNFVISSGCDMPPTCNWDCIDAFFAEVTRFYQQKVK